jgi:nicotinamidase-related amidase
MDVRPGLADLVQPSRAALVVVDVQNDFCDPVYAPSTVAMLPRLKRLVEAARAAGVQVIFTQDIQADRWNTPTWLSRHDTRPHRVGKCLEGTSGAELHPGFQPEGTDIVVQKHRYSVFVGTDFELILRARNTETLVFTGIATNVCVESAVRDAFMRDYWTVTVSDCTATFSEVQQAVSLEVIARNFGRVARSEDLLAIWQPVSVPIPVR